MEITSFKKINKVSGYLKNLIKPDRNLMGGYSKFRIPSLEEINYYNDNVSQILMQNIWETNNTLFLDKIKNVCNDGNIEENSLEDCKLIVPQVKPSNILLIRSQVVAGLNYNAIVSIIFNDIPNRIRTEYYEINYFVPLN